jgi:hypothetical protein
MKYKGAFMSRSTRFEPAPLDHALVDFRNEKEGFIACAVALIANESYTGCALVIKTDEPLAANQIIKVQVGRLAVMSAKIIWTTELEPSLLKIGLQFLE